MPTVKGKVTIELVRGEKPLETELTVSVGAEEWDMYMKNSPVVARHAPELILSDRAWQAYEEAWSIRVSKAEIQE